MENSIQSRGGKARAEKLSPEQRQACARKAAQARWGNYLLSRGEAKKAFWQVPLSRTEMLLIIGYAYHAKAESKYFRKIAEGLLEKMAKALASQYGN